jgi:nucleotide-binding universal stress UspA family protein
MTPVPRTIIAVTTEDDRHVMVVDRAAGLAIETNATVILYDLDADMGALESPFPMASSGDGEEDRFGDRLGPNDLEAAGRHALADQVRVIRAAGINAFGWLPPKPDADSLVEYAARQGADLVLVSADDAGLIDALEPVGRIRVEAVAPS